MKMGMSLPEMGSPNEDGVCRGSKMGLWDVFVGAKNKICKR